jgi:hypothetical protein
MHHGRSTLPRLCVILLLLLAVSPVTAPFSTCDLLDLFGGCASSGGPVLHSKSTPDEPVPGGGGGSAPQVPGAVSGVRVLESVAQPRWRVALYIPLRI